MASPLEEISKLVEVEEGAIFQRREAAAWLEDSGHGELAGDDAHLLELFDGNAEAQVISDRQPELLGGAPSDDDFARARARGAAGSEPIVEPVRQLLGTCVQPGRVDGVPQAAADGDAGQGESRCYSGDRLERPKLRHRVARLFDGIRIR